MKAAKQIRRMQGIAATRIRLGFSQTAFALELGISRSLLSLVETRKRTLPTAALIKLSALEIQLAATATANIKQPAYATATGIHADDYTTAFLLQKQTCCQLEAQKKECELKLMTARYRQITQSLQQLQALQNESIANPARFLPGHLELHRYTLLHKLHKCSLPAQAALRHKIALLHAAAGLHEVNARMYSQRTTLPIM